MQDWRYHSSCHFGNLVPENRRVATALLYCFYKSTPHYDAIGMGSEADHILPPRNAEPHGDRKGRQPSHISEVFQKLGMEATIFARHAKRRYTIDKSAGTLDDIGYPFP